MLVLTALLSGCKVVDAPKNLEALMVFGFTNFEDDKALEETERNLIPLVEKQLEELEKGYRVADLTREDLEAAGVNAAKGEIEIIGAMGTVDYTHNIDPVLKVVIDEDKEIMFPDNFVAYEVKKTTEVGCFLSGECETMDQEVFERTKISLLGEGQRTYDSNYAWFEGDDELPRALFMRQIAPKEMKFEGSAINMTVHQQYSFVMLYEKNGFARRVEAFWVDAELVGVDVPDTFAIDTAVNSISDQAARVDTWIDEH